MNCEVCPILTGVCNDDMGPTGPPEQMGVLNSQVPQGHMDRQAVFRQVLPEVLQMSQVLQDPEVKQAIHAQDPRGFHKPDFKDGTAPQVLAEQPEQLRPSQAQQG